MKVLQYRRFERSVSNGVECEQLGTDYVSVLLMISSPRLSGVKEVQTEVLGILARDSMSESTATSSGLSWEALDLLGKIVSRNGTLS